MLSTKFPFTWPSGFRGEDLFKSTNQKQELPLTAMFVNGSGQDQQSLQRNFRRCFLQSVGSFGQAISENMFQNPTNQKQELHVATMLINGSGRNVQSLQRMFHRCFLLSYGSFGQAVSEKKIDQSEQNCLWCPCLLTDREEMCNCYREPFIDAFYQDLIHLAKRLQRRRFLKIDQSKSRIAFGGHVY